MNICQVSLKLPVSNARSYQQVSVFYLILALQNVCFYSPSVKVYAEVLNKKTNFLFLHLILLQNKNQGSVSMLLKI